MLENVQEQLQNIQNLTQFVADKVIHVAKQVDLTHKDIKSFGQMVISLQKEASSKKLERQDMPSKPTIFYGYDQLVKKMARLLSSSETALHMGLLGPGGMGKTSLALAIIESPVVQAKFQEDNRVWVPCLEATSGSLFLQVLYTSLRVQCQTDSVMSDILYKLKTSKDPNLLLPNNFETPWNTGDGQRQVEEALSKLNQLSHVFILITMRESHSPTVDMEWHSEIVPPTDKDASFRICQRFNPHWKMNPDLESLPDAVGCMPFAVTLMAACGRDSESSPKQLLEESTQLGTGMWPSDGPLATGMNKSIGLSVDSKPVKSNPDAINLLATLLLLPAGTTRECLVHWAPNLKNMSHVIATLSQAALLQTATWEGNQVLHVLPVIQSFMVHHYHIPERIQQVVRSAFCKYTLDHACRYCDPSFVANAKALDDENTNIQSILVRPVGHADCNNDLVQALLAFSWYRCDTKPLISIAKHTLALAEANGNKEYIAEAFLCLGASLEAVDDHVGAEGILEQCSQLLAGDHIHHQLSFECALTRMHISLFLHCPSWQECITIVQDVLVRTKDSDEYWHAHGLNTLGSLYAVGGLGQQAMEAFTLAANLLLCLGCNRDAGLALYGKAHALAPKGPTFRRS